MSEDIQPPMMAVPAQKLGFIRPNRCENCKYSTPSGEPQAPLDCRFGPPMSTALFMGIGRNPVTGQQGPQIQIISSFPKVQLHDFCGQHINRAASIQ